MVQVNLEPVTLIGRVYETGSFEERSPFAAVFTVMLLGGGKAKLMAAHGHIDIKACGEIARQLRANYGVTALEMERHGRQISVGADRPSDFGNL